MLRDSIELALSIKLIVSGEGFFIFFGNVNDARFKSIPDLLNLLPRCFCFSVAVKKCNIVIVFGDKNSLKKVPSGCPRQVDLTGRHLPTKSVKEQTKNR